MKLCFTGRIKRGLLGVSECFVIQRQSNPKKGEIGGDDAILARCAVQNLPIGTSQEGEIGGD